MSPRGPGLRLILLVALAVAFLLSFALLDVAAVKLAERAGRERFGEFLLLYAALTSGAIVLLTYVVLTVLIVRPVDALTRASERLARGQLDVAVPVSGAGEVARLGASFNAMASQLRLDRASLEARVAELTATTARLERAKDHVARAEKLATVGRLAAGLAHEIGNPLAAVIGLLDLLRAGGLTSDEEREFLDRAKRETERIHAILRDLLDYARGDQGGADTSGTASLEDVVEESLMLLAPQKSLRGVRLEREFATPLPPVRGRPERLVQVVMNLLWNATDAVGGTGTIRLVLARDDEAVELRVEDTGPGIADDVHATLFEPFVTTKPVGQGTGLGLAVCHTIVEGLGGSIRAENKVEGGARVVVRLPIANGAST